MWKTTGKAIALISLNNTALHPNKGRMEVYRASLRIERQMMALF
jgi:hypothetical protein